MALANERQGDGAAKLSKEDQEDLAAMNAAIDRMRAFTPADPYVLTIPQDEPRYHHHYAIQARQWLENTPFDPRDDKDERIQYQTFVYHEPNKGMYMLHNSRPPDAGTNTSTNGDGEMRGKEKAGTGANTPNAGPKKKISLDAYKRKQTGQTPEVKPAKELGQLVKKHAAKGVVERLKEDEEVLAAVEEDVSINATNEAVPTAAKNELKRKREEEPVKAEVGEERDKKQAQHDTPQDSAEPATKKLKPTTPPEEPVANSEPAPETQPASKASNSPKKASALVTEYSNEDKLPPKLSPPPRASEDDSMPPKLSPISIPPLPPRLSPTIPPNIEATLKAQEHLRSVSRSSDKSLSKDAAGRTLTPPPTKPGKKKSPAPRNGFRANSSSPAVRSDVEERGRPATSVPKRFKLSDAESAEDSEEIAVSRKRKALPEQQKSENAQSGNVRSVESQSKEVQPEKPELVVKLRFKKSTRERLRSLLRTKPMPDKSLSSQLDSSKTAPANSGTRRNSNTKGIAQKVRPPHATNGVAKKSGTQQLSDRKRGPSDDTSESDAPVNKRKRATTDASEPRRNEPTTPVRSDVPSPSSAQKSSSQLSPNNLRKDVLSVSMKRDLSTDSTMHTPNATSQHSPPASVKDTLQTSNGTAKPPSSQPSSKTPKQQAWEREQKRLENVGRDLKRAVPVQSDQQLAAINALESVLAFILAFICADEAALTADPRQPPSTKPWISIQKYFGFVKKTCEPFPVLHGLVCSLGVVFNAHILELVAQHPGETVSRDQLLETQTMMQRAANDAESKLDIDTLQSTFRRTWTRRDRGVLGQPRLEPGKGFAGTYKLPIGMQTSPLRAVRAGYAMLEEWVEAQDGLNYELKLKL
jgi:hypothetical protein